MSAPLPTSPPLPLTGGDIDVRALRPWLNALRECVAQLVRWAGSVDRVRAGRAMDPLASFARIDELVVGGGKSWLAADWTGTPSDVVYCPYDGVTAPSYAASMPAMTSMPADDGSNPRALGMYIDLTRVPGPCFHVQRA